MDFVELQDEVIGLRFQEGDRDQVKSWINMRYQWLWNHKDWHFRRVAAANMTVTAGAATEPADFGKAVRLTDPRGDETVYLDPDTFEENYTTLVPVPTGTAEAYTVIDRSIIVGPQETGTFKLSYKRRLSHVDTILGVTGGILIDDTDQTIWPAEHDYVLVLEAVLLGQRIQGDPTEGFLRQARDEALRAMVEDLVGGTEDVVEVWSAAG